MMPGFGTAYDTSQPPENRNALKLNLLRPKTINIAEHGKVIRRILLHDLLTPPRGDVIRNKFRGYAPPMGSNANGTPPKPRL